MDKLVVSPMQWNTLPDMDTMECKLDATDATCLAAVRQVLKDHGKLSRFGLALLHQHFTLRDDECLLETIDVSERTLTVRPVNRSELHDAVPTQWALASPDVHQWCSAYCDYKDGEHKTWHKANK